MNRGKVGCPVKYSHSMMACIAMIRVMWGESYRKCRGKLKRCCPNKTIPNFCTIWKSRGVNAEVRAGRGVPPQAVEHGVAGGRQHRDE